MAYYALLDRTPKGRDERARNAALGAPPRDEYPKAFGVSTRSSI